MTVPLSRFWLGSCIGKCNYHHSLFDCTYILSTLLLIVFFSALDFDYTLPATASGNIAVVTLPNSGAITSTGTLTIVIIDDNILELKESFSVEVMDSVVNPFEISGDGSSITIYILDNDGPSEIYIMIMVTSFKYWYQIKAIGIKSKTFSIPKLSLLYL